MVGQRQRGTHFLSHHELSLAAKKEAGRLRTALEDAYVQLCAHSKPATAAGSELEEWDSFRGVEGTEFE